MSDTYEFEHELDSGFKLSARYRNKGNELIVFIHGLGCSMDSYNCIWSSEPLARYSLMTVDLLGFGRSDKPLDFDYKLEQQADALSSLLTKFAGSPIVVGHSFGGAISVLLLERINIKGFINIEGNLTHHDGGLISRRTAAHSEAEFIIKVFPRFCKQFPSIPSGHFSLDRCSPVAFYRSACSLVEWSDSDLLLEKFQQFDRPKCYMHGDQLMTKDTIALLQDIPLVPIGESGHFTMMDNPTSFCQSVDAFVLRNFNTTQCSPQL